MKRYELLNDAKKAWDVVKPICDALADNGEVLCERCPFAELCAQGSNGLMNWLNEEVQDG